MALTPSILYNGGNPTSVTMSIHRVAHGRVQR